LFRSIIKAVVREADHIRAISDRVAAQAARAGVDGHRITVATSRVNLRRFQGRGSTTMRDAVRRRHAITNDKVVGYLGRLHHLKGLITLLRAWALVTAQVPDATLVIVGDGPERQHLHRLASTIDGPARVVFAGACAYDDVPLWLDAFDIFVLPSLTEGTPRALLEAMAMELPVVATSVGDIPYGVLDPSSGVVVPPAEPEALANAILALLADPTRAQAMGRNARNTVVGKFEFAESIRNLALSHYRAAGRPMPLGT
jgi:glycosyltransferase involved in cell wall biosynthesis